MSGSIIVYANPSRPRFAKYTALWLYMFLCVIISSPGFNVSTPAVLTPQQAYHDLRINSGTRVRPGPAKMRQGFYSPRSGFAGRAQRNRSGKPSRATFNTDY